MFSQTATEADDEQLEDAVVMEFPYSFSPYTPYQVNMIIASWLKEKKDEIKTLDKFYVEKKDNYCAGYLITCTTSGNKIALFNVVNPSISCQHNSQFDALNQPSIVCQHNSKCPTLEESLDAYLKKKVNSTKLIIPIAQLKRNHFRLLVIEPEKKKAVFYESKSMVVGKIAEYWTASFDEYQYIAKTCEKYFSLSWITGDYRGHQAWYNHRDCGPYTLEYAFNEILNSSFTNDIDLLRGKHEELFQKQLLSEEKEHPKKEPESPSKRYKGMFYLNDTMQSPKIVEPEEDFEMVSFDKSL